MAAPRGGGTAHGRGPDTRGIEARLRSDIAGLQGAYGIAVVDLTSGAAYGLDADGSFRAASVNKMPILIALYQRAAQGQLNLDQTVTLSDDDIQHYGTGLIQDTGSSRTYSLRELAALMIETSDNTAAHVLERYVGEDTIQATLPRWGIQHTSMADNTTTPADAAKLFANLYRGQLLTAPSTQIAISLLQHTVFNDRLAAGLPPNVAVAHKVGTDAGVFNDAGIVLAPGRPYALAVLSQSAEEDEAQQVFERISKDVFSFQSSLPRDSGAGVTQASSR